MKNKKIPEIRFFDFVKEWESKKFSEIWIKSSERNTDMFYSPDQIISVSQMKLSPSDRESKDDYMKTYNVIHYGDIAFEGNKSKNFSFGRFVLNDLQDGIVSHVFTVYRPRIIMDIDFMKYYINNEEMMRHVLVKATTKTLMMTNLNTKDINRQKLNLPSIDEQKKIGSFLKHLDNTIETHQQELTTLKQTKQGFLQKMFPREGKKVPEVRFPEFTDDWEWHILKDILAEKITNGMMNRPGKNEMLIKHINVVNLYSPSYIHSEELDYIDATCEEFKKYNVQVGDIFLTRSSLKVEGIAQANILLDEGDFVFDDHLMRMKVFPDYHPFFVKELLNHGEIKKQFMAKSKTGTMTTIGQEDISFSSDLFPSFEEQKKIGNFFIQLDDMITLHQRELELLQLTKKAFLQKLFV